MEKIYQILKLPEEVESLRLKGEFHPDEIPLPWSGLNEAKLDQFPWKWDYEPECAARVGWNSKGLHVLMYGFEPVIRCKETQIGGPVCDDSCLEFFVAPDISRPTYINCESNPLCVMHIGIGDNRYDRKVFDHIPAGFHPSHSVHCGGWWAVSYTIPADFILEHFGVILQPELRMRGNFYSCGDREFRRHNGMYKGYSIEKPDYHRPELFADMMLC